MKGHDRQMNTPSTAEIAAMLGQLSPEYAPTPLLDLPKLAALCGVAQVLVKDEGRRMLRSFKSLGGTYAGLRALARASGMEVPALIAARPAGQKALICASDGNHGLAVAAAARFAGAPSRVFLHATVPAPRAQRIAEMGAEIVWVDGTYDDAVDAAAAAARDSGGILVADTTDRPDDPVVHDVMAGYGVIAAEIRDQIVAAGHERPTHLFIQAGVGGLAAAMAAGLGGWLDAPRAIVAVEPEAAPCVSAALATGKVVRVAGDLETTAGMLSCGEASAPAFAVLLAHGATAMTVPEKALDDLPALLATCDGPRTTPSGGAGVAGAILACTDPARQHPGPQARILLVISEAALPGINA